jgi:Hypoxia induced protein conserved region
MSGTLNIIIPILIAAVTVILALGLWNMMRGGSANRSQTLMRLRVLIQFVAIVAVMAALYIASSK